MTEEREEEPTSPSLTENQIVEETPAIAPQEENLQVQNKIIVE